MATALHILLRDPCAHFSRPLRLRDDLRLFAAGVCGAALWGAAMGAHVGRAHLWICALKMPLFLLGTLALCFPLMHVVLLVSGVRASARQTRAVALAGLATFATCLGALSPVVALFCASAPIPSMASYLNLYVLCLVCGACAGVAGLRAMVHGMRALAPGRRGWLPLAAWALAYQFTGAQVAWVLRPWIGSSYGVGGYSLDHGLSGNFYTGVGKVLARWLTEYGVLT
jgi:hypothetical protein